MGSASEQIRKFLLEEEEEDDELFFVLVPAILAALQSEKCLYIHHLLSNVEKAQEKSSPIKPREKEGATGKNRKHNQVALVLKNYLEFKKEQTQKIVEKIAETSKQEIDYSIAKCISIVEAILELTDEEKTKVLGLFRCPINREIFMNTTIPSVRLIWLRSQIAS